MFDTGAGVPGRDTAPLVARGPASALLHCGDQGQDGLARRNVRVSKHWPPLLLPRLAQTQPGQSGSQSQL